MNTATLPLITPHLVSLSECVCEELTERGAGPLCSCTFYPGALPAFDGCSECTSGTCGMGWLRVVTAFPSDSFPLQSFDPHCRKEMVWQLEIGAVRCMPVEQDGGPLDEQTLAEVWVGQMLDAEAIARAVFCCDVPSIMLDTYTPIGPDGGCVGGSWSVFAGL